VAASASSHRDSHPWGGAAHQRSRAKKGGREKIGSRLTHGAAASGRRRLLKQKRLARLLSFSPGSFSTRRDMDRLREGDSSAPGAPREGSGAPTLFSCFIFIGKGRRRLRAENGAAHVCDDDDGRAPRAKPNWSEEAQVRHTWWPARI
jgi:hypothetical protein